MFYDFLGQTEAEMLYVVASVNVKNRSVLKTIAHVLAGCKCARHGVDVKV